MLYAPQVTAALALATVRKRLSLIRRLSSAWPARASSPAATLTATCLRSNRARSTSGRT